ncbi:MAG: glycosyltransferase family 39 protein [Ardenticatenaceae bacterium]|nr:glycosyltransferase family 39 protein [Ardenticatenaceae bacterium]
MFTLRRAFLILLILLAFGLRIYAITDIPPGLTHDEANHGREGMEVLDGVYRYYFPLNYGSEPIYSYTVAGSMALLGENLFALRYVNIVFGLLTISISYAWSKRQFGWEVGVLTAVLLTLSFWPLASSRQALRAGMLPFFTVASVSAFWQMGRNRAQIDLINADFFTKLLHRRWLNQENPANLRPILLLTLALLATLHIYLAARVSWLMFPAFLIYLALFHRPLFRRWWLPAAIGLLLTGLLIIPMFIYLANHPEAQTRLGMLDGTLQAVASGNVVPLLKTASEALLAFVWSGYGDQFLAYNIPGRPVLDVITAVFFLIGLLVSLWRWRQPRYAFVLLWFGIGILPSLLTGPTANTTRNLAALPVIHLLPALGAVAAGSKLDNRWLKAGLTAVWLLFTTITTNRDYFIRWAQSPEVRSAYQHTLVETIAYWRTHPSDGSLLFSTVYPGPVHDNSIATVLAHNQLPDNRWTDARWALVLPSGSDLRLFIPASAPPHPAFLSLLNPLETITLRPTDLDPSFTVYQLSDSRPEWLQDLPTGGANFNNAITLLRAVWLASTTPPGGVAELLTVWRVADPSRIAPAIPPAYAPEAKLFTHVLRDDGSILTQADQLDAPAWSWQTGDIVIQIHQLWVPPETAVSTYPTRIGFYEPTHDQRTPIVDAVGNPVDDAANVAPLEIAAP